MSQAVFPFANLSEVTPMMKQYLSIKKDYQDMILFYRMGDFYEMFFDDAIIAADILNIALTKRGKLDENDIPMCGIPYHSSENYLNKLIISGYKVAICEQMESPEEAKKRGYKSVVKREVVRLVTPGTIIEENLLNPKSANFLVSITYQKQNYAIAWIDISTGQFGAKITDLTSVGSDLARLDPKEIILSDYVFNNEVIKSQLSQWKKILSPHVNSFFDVTKCMNKLKSFYGISSLDSFGELTEAQISALGSVLEYISVTHKESFPAIKFPEIVSSDLFMIIDHSTRKNLELTSNSDGTRGGTLLEFIDKTATSIGARMLTYYLSSPLIDVVAINNRLDFLEFFYQESKLAKAVNNCLKNIADIERISTRLSGNYAGPKDLEAIRSSFVSMFHLSKIIYNYGIPSEHKLIKIIENICGFEDIVKELADALKSDLPSNLKDGNFIKEGYNNRYDQLISLEFSTKTRLKELQQKYAKISTVQNLKINQNNLLGYFIEITPQHTNKMDKEIFIHKQSLASAVRYTTDELIKLENEITHSEELIAKLEFEIFEQLRSKVIAKKEEISVASNSIGLLDVASSLALIAIENNFIRPILDNSTEFNIVKGRHPVVEHFLKKINHEEFIENDCEFLDKQRIWLLTGPNMAGKSTFLRQNAIITILAQIGSFVPANYAKIGIVDRVFCRVGAGDDLARGRSTFMVEMVETATILNQASSRSLVILDEIGRGTSTFDGVSIAWSCLEYIHNKIGARTLFATHYHELIQLEQELDQLKCFRAAVKEWDEKVVFLHKVEPGFTDKSYGIHVAKLAGIPAEVVDRANIILKFLQNGERSNANISTNRFESEFSNYLDKIEINNITPFEALNHLIKLKNMMFVSIN